VTAWYEESFGCDYLELYAHRDAAEARADIEAVVRLLDPPRDEPLLDLCCGACRHMLVLHEMGFSQMVGLDLSAELLEVGASELQECACPDGLDEDGICLVHSDMRCIPYENHFATVLSLFTSFGYFDRDQENEAVFHAVYRALRPGGQFLIDYLSREYVIANLVERDELDLSGRHIVNVRSLTDGGRRVTKKTTVTSSSGSVREYLESVRMYSESEMVGMLREAGLVDVRTYGSLEKEPFGPESKRLIAVCRKA
jgi:ubiquinone/menaquinone biosynthesis C-methylase UbiE